ncbi:ABC transporter substrate-binding protein, partial [Roseovarius sp. HI0049]
GFRAEFVDTILGANAHVTIYSGGDVDQQTGRIDRTIEDYEAMAERVRQVPGVTRVAPLVKGQVMGNARDRSAGVEVFGIALDDLKTIPRIANPETSHGDIEAFPNGIALGGVLARDLGVSVGDRIKLISPNGVKTALGSSPRVNAYEVVYVFEAGRYDIDKIRAYLPFEEAQSFFNREGRADELEVMLEEPEALEAMAAPLRQAAGERAYLWTWKDSSGSFLRALDVEDNVMFVILSVLVLIAAMNITSGLIMLVKNKGRDIGILRTMGLTEGSVLRVFFICGAFTGVIGTAFGVLLGCLFAIYIDPIFALLDSFSDQPIWTPD